RPATPDAAAWTSIPGGRPRAMNGRLRRATHASSALRSVSRGLLHRRDISLTGAMRPWFPRTVSPRMDLDEHRQEARFLQRAGLREKHRRKRPEAGFQQCAIVRAVD